ncbi:MAG: hypothetical protein IPM79_39925 [Polyangiaceae bacterium]|nr:hypothetical protein [Polyangiaceae bacterium]
MARLPEAGIERLKRDVSLEELVRRRGVELTRTGANLVGLCPFHDDKNTPNLVVTPERNVWHCPYCQVGGSVIDWVMKTEVRGFPVRGGAAARRGVAGRACRAGRLRCRSARHRRMHPIAAPATPRRRSCSAWWTTTTRR